MKNKILIFMLVFLFSISYVLAVDCDPSNLVQGCLTVSGTTITLNGSSYNFNGTGSNTVGIQVLSNSVLDCNNSRFYGNWSIGSSTTSKGIYIGYSQYNITLKNCYLENYYYGVYIDSGYNISVSSNVITSVRNGIYNYRPYNVTIISNNISRSQFEAIYSLYNPNGTIIKNNILTNNTYYSIALFFSNYSLVSNNTVYSTNWTGIITFNGLNNSFYNNTVFNIPNANGIELGGGSLNSIVSYNFLKNNSCGIMLTNSNNSIVQNNLFSNYSGRGICSSSSNYSLISYNVFNNIYGNSIDFASLSSSNIIFYNNFSNTTRALYLFTGSYNNFSLNYAVNSTNEVVYLLNNSAINYVSNNQLFNSGSYGISIWHSKDSLVNYNYITGVTHAGIVVFGDSGNVIDHNNISYVRGRSHGIDMNGYQIFNTTISFNNIFGNDKGMIFMNGANYTFVYNNTLYNQSALSDYWYLGIMLINAQDTYIFNNNISYILAGVLRTNGTILSVYNNYFNQESSVMSKGFGVPAAVFDYELYQTFDNNEPDTLDKNRTNHITFFRSRNLTVLNNVFLPTVNVFMRVQNTTYLVHDLSNFRYKAFNIDVLTDKDEFWINNLFNNITTTGGGDASNSPNTNVLKFGYNNNFFVFCNFSFFDICTNFWFNSFVIHSYNLTDKVIYYRNALYRTNFSNVNFDYVLNLNESEYEFNFTNFNTSYYWNNALFWYPNKSLQLNSDLSFNTGFLNILFDKTNNLTYAINNFYISNFYKYYNSPFEIVSDTDSLKSFNWFLDSVISPLNFSVKNCLTLSNVYFNGELISPFDYFCQDNYIYFTSSVNKGINSLIFNVEYQNVSDPINIRIPVDNSAVAYSSQCGSTLAYFKYESESGCSSYTGSECSASMFSDANKYTLLKSGGSYNVPVWAQSGKSCLYSFIDSNTKEVKLVQAFRVKGNGGQFCTIQNKWNWFIYAKSNDTSMDLSPYALNNPFYIENSCDPLANSHGASLSVDFSNPIYIIILILVFITVVLLLCFGFPVYAALITILTGLVLMYSGIVWIISFSVFLAGVVMIFIPEDFNLLRILSRVR